MQPIGALSQRICCTIALLTNCWRHYRLNFTTSRAILPNPAHSYGLRSHSSVTPTAVGWWGASRLLLAPQCPCAAMRPQSQAPIPQF